MRFLKKVRKLWGLLTGHVPWTEKLCIYKCWFWRRPREDRPAWRRRVFRDGYWPWWVGDHLRVAIPFCWKQWRRDRRALWIVLAIKSLIVAVTWPFLDKRWADFGWTRWHILYLTQTLDEMERYPDEFNGPLRLVHVLGSADTRYLRLK